MPSSEPALFQSGIPSFDILLGGGIPSRQALIVTGTPGSGKTVMCSQIAFAAAARGVPVVVATVTSEPHDKLMGALSSFDFFQPELLGEKLFFISAYSALKRGAKEARDLLLQTVREHGAGLLFIDGLRSIRDLWQDEARLREFLYELGISLAAINCIGLFTTEYPLDRLMALPEATTVDGIVALSIQPHGSRRVRRVEVVKLRGRPHLSGEHTLIIRKEGVVTLPRLESTHLEYRDEPPTLTRKSFGLPELDALMHGGIPELSTTMLAGSMGIGKTLVALHFAAAAARHGEKALFVSFFDAPSMLTARARRVGLDVDPALREGRLVMRYVPPIETEADVLVQDLLAEVDALGVKRLVLDGLTELEMAILDPARRRTFLASLAMRLRMRGITALFTREVSKVVGTELDFNDAPVASLGENVLLLRYVELHGQMHRLLSVLKMRDSEYVADLREFVITNAGVKVLAPIRSAVGLLTGQARPLGTTIGGAGE